MKRIILLVQALVLCMMVACNNDDNNSNNNNSSAITPPTAQEFAALQSEALESLVQDFVFDAGSMANLTSENGVIITIYGGCLTQNGNPVTGNVNLEYVEIFNRGNMVATNKPTMGIMPNGDKALLVSGGEFYISATKNGQPVQLNCGIMLQVPASLTGGTDNGMTFWQGTIDEDGDLVWEEAEEAGQENGVGVEEATYYVFGVEFGWTNIDRWYSDPRPKTTILVDVPEGYDNQNSAVYVSYDDEGVALAQLDTYNPVTGLFSEHYGQIPIGLECHIIFVSEDDGMFTYAIKAVTIQANGIITFTDADLSTISQAGLVAAINNLP
jgi:hypothetical protein